MSKKTLDGFIPYSPELVREYTENGGWEGLSYGDLLDMASEKSPDRIAVIDDRTRMTYKTLKGKVDRFAIALLGLGIKPHDRIVLQMPNRYEFLVALYGMHRIGAVPVLAIPRHSRKEISFFLNTTKAIGWILPLQDGKIEFRTLMDDIRSGSTVLKHIIIPDTLFDTITDIETRDRAELPPYALSMEKLMDEVRAESLEGDILSPYRPDPNDVAMLIPTGGTTGLPKLVPRSYNSLIVTNRAISNGVNASDRLLQATPVGHAMAMQGAVNCALYRGATLVLQGIPKPSEIMKTIEREKVTRVFLVPTQLEGIIDHPELEKYDLTTLRVLTTAGAAMPRDVAEKAYNFFRSFGCKFSGNALGASEGILATGDPDDSLDVQLSTVGRNVTPGSHYKIIDKEERELPTGREGELVAKGPEVFTGYYMTTEEENREVFTSDGYYRTGDLAVIDNQGFIRITGRIKDVIQRGGETLIPSEMEELIRKHPNVDSVAVVAMPDPKMGERACAYVVTKPGKSLNFEEMITFLKKQGASVLLFPERLELTDTLPVTGVGKIDKKTLRDDIEQKLKQEGVIR